MKSGEQALIQSLYAYDVFRYGQFTLKSGQISKIYIDLRGIISNPQLMNQAVEAQWQTIEANKIQYDIICGVPYAALPLAAGICLNHNKPMVIRRKEAKDYGTKKLIEGRYTAGQKCLIVEDVVTHGDSIIDTVKLLRDEGLVVTDAIVLLNRQQGAEEKLKENGIQLHSALCLRPVIDMLVQEGKFTEEQKQEMFDSLKTLTCPQDEKAPVAAWTLENRMKLDKMTEKSKQLLKICTDKQSNLCVAIDLTQSSEIIELIRCIGSEVCMVKIHADIIEDFSGKFWTQLLSEAQSQNFMLMADRKLADTGNTVSHQLNGVLKISQWADFVTVHPLPGSSVFQGVVKVISENERRFEVVVVAEMSSEGALTTHLYKNEALKLTNQFKEHVSGFVCQNKCINDPSYLFFTPGVNIDQSGDGLGQQFRSPTQAIKQGNDIVIVGRAITEASNPLEQAKLYRKDAWQAVIRRDSPELCPE